LLHLFIPRTDLVLGAEVDEREVLCAHSLRDSCRPGKSTKIPKRINLQFALDGPQKIQNL
jgi:hypothetical protein